MHATRRTTVAIAAIAVVLAGCAQSSGDSLAVSATDVETASDQAPEATGDGPEDASNDQTVDHGGAHDEPQGGRDESASSRPTVDEDVSAAFEAHAGAHTAHEPTAEVRDLPTGVVPARLEIPAIGVDAVVGDLSLAGPEPEVPEDFDRVGWYTQTREPGEIGPAVLAGHIDSREGPAVFVDLDELQPGDEIVVTAATGELRRFVVDELGQYPKDDLPDEVFGFGAPSPELRLITCGGSFDRATGHYRDNVVVYASLADD